MKYLFAIYILFFSSIGSALDNNGIKDISILLKGKHNFALESVVPPKKLVNKISWRLNNGKMQYVYENVNNNGIPKIATTQWMFKTELPYGDCVAIEIPPRNSHTAGAIYIWHV